MKLPLLPLATLFATATALTPSAAISSTSPSSTPKSFPAPDLTKITSVPPTTFKSYHLGNLHRTENISLPSTASRSRSLTKRWSCTSSPIFTWGDPDTTPGIRITNGDSGPRGFYVYHNSCDGSPYKYIWIDPGQTRFVSLPDRFEGRIIRGEDYLLDGQPQLLATWLEFSFDAQGWAWGDVSLIRGCDGATLMWSEDGSGAWKGWDWWILDGAPGDAYAQKRNGPWVLKWTENNDGSINTPSRDWYMSQVGVDRVYVDDDHGNPVIASTNGRFGTHWGPGRP